MKNALIIVDMQNDFLPGGALPVPEGDQILPLINRLLTYPFHLLVATKDWHPKTHCSFAINHPGKKVGEYLRIGTMDQRLWPEHCVQHSMGAEFSKEWRSEKVNTVFYKGTDPSIDSYSAFYDNGHFKSTGLGEFLKEKQVDLLFFAGVATEYCVKYSVLDALRLGFKVIVIQDACKGIDQSDAAEAIKEMQRAGALMTSTSTL